VRTGQSRVNRVSNFYMDVATDRRTLRSRSGRRVELARLLRESDSPSSGAEVSQPVTVVSADVRPGTFMLVVSGSARTARSDGEDATAFRISGLSACRPRSFPKKPPATA
jgi:hypothetical protein